MTQLRDAKLDFMIAESGIRQLYGRYADAVWRKDPAAFVDCFAEDAVWKIAGRTVRGRAEIGGLFEMTLVPSERVMMWVGIPVLDVGKGVATGRVQVTELIKRKNGASARTLAIYYERYVEEGDVWRFKWHHFNLYSLGPPDLSDSYYENLEYGPPPGMPGPEDPTTIVRR